MIAIPDPLIARLESEMAEATAELELAACRLVDADPEPFIRAMLAVPRRQASTPRPA